ncbi:hypothetical protein AVEN_255273-1 [Araneus ventricosus]|uniref:Integrase catalytic domain-containing protein n=1 Tax=Araneus ventricosus TaxID=182803 RepID=A0A4Y2B9X4_ARAVE|nr:hypothetical protein AVEN_255273-1 [Araneus ventricosus]
MDRLYHCPCIDKRRSFGTQAFCEKPKGIVWHFNPPATPHFGDLWESGVKSLNSHLKRVVGNTVLTHEEFSTLVTQVEAVLNSKPLCNLSSDRNDDFVLTPAHILVGSSLTDPDLTEVPMNRLNT